VEIDQVEEENDGSIDTKGDRAVDREERIDTGGT
jgi:hypothetical protein